MKTIFYIYLIILFLLKSVPCIEASDELLKYVMPSADSFSVQTGKLPYYKAYSGKKQIGICYISSDILPGIIGYNGPIKVLIGLYSTGKISKIKVLEHVENIIEAYEIEKKYFENRFKGKSINEGFKVGKDVDNITGATVTVEVICEIVKLSSSIMYEYCFKKGEPERLLQEINQKKKILRGKYMEAPLPEKINIIPYISGGIIFLILLFLALNFRLLLRKKIKRTSLSFLITIQVAVIFYYIIFINSSYKQFYDREYIDLSKIDPEITSIKKKISSDRSPSLGSSKKPGEKEIIYNPKWKVKKVNEDLIDKQIKSGNLSEREADFSKK